jgi:hypothetical protein
MQSELERNRAILTLVEKKDVELLKAFAQALRLSTLGRPTRLVSVWEADSASRVALNSSARAQSASAG